jgi:meso-butanediol dehydrogenase/(S,S)-butanediol dehydrogenase/diacetyl reductase
MPEERKAALVLGGSGSIGAAVVKRLTKAGCSVMAVGRTNARLNHLLKEAPRAMPYTADCTSEAQVRRCVEAFLAFAGRLDFVVHTSVSSPTRTRPSSVTQQTNGGERWRRTSRASS